MFNLNYEIHPSQMKRILIQAMTYWCGHHMMAHLWRLSLSFILSLFGFILSIGLVFEIIIIIEIIFIDLFGGDSKHLRWEA